MRATMNFHGGGRIRVLKPVKGGESKWRDIQILDPEGMVVLTVGVFASSPDDDIPVEIL